MSQVDWPVILFWLWRWREGNTWSWKGPKQKLILPTSPEAVQPCGPILDLWPPELGDKKFLPQALPTHFPCCCQSNHMTTQHVYENSCLKSFNVFISPLKWSPSVMLWRAQPCMIRSHLLLQLHQSTTPVILSQNVWGEFYLYSSLPVWP